MTKPGESAEKATPIQQMIDEDREHELAEQEEADLERELNIERDKDGKVISDPGAPERKIVEVKRDAETGELIVTEEEDESELSDEEKARRLAEAAKPEGEKPGEVSEETLAKVDAQWADLVKDHPELKTLVPEGGTLRSVFHERREIDRQRQELADRQRQQEEAERTRTQLVADEKMEKVIGDEVARRIANQGYTNIPKTKQEWDQLWDDHPGQAYELRESIRKADADVRSTLLTTKSAIDGQTGHNSRVVESDFKAIQAFAKKGGITVEEKDFVTFAQKYLTDPRVNESRSGVRYLIPGALFERWKLDNFDQLTAGISLSREQAARQQAIDATRRRGPVTAGSTSHGVTGKRERRIPLDDEEALRDLPEETLMKGYFQQ